jgi:hypothetical protein
MTLLRRVPLGKCLIMRRAREVEEKMRGATEMAG